MSSERRTSLYSFLFPTLMAVAACQSISKLDKLKFDGGVKSHENAQLPAADVNTGDSGPKPPPHKDAAVDAAQDGGKDSGPEPCAIADGNECDPFRQCGCEAGNHCQVIGDDQRAKCRPIGTSAAWGACKAASQCPEGQTCDRGSCRPYCKDDKGCEDGSCVPLIAPDGEASKRYNVCWKHCDAKQNPSACADGTSCRPLKTPRGAMGAFCAAAADPCPSVEDGKCDEAKGTGACVDGTDKKDCCERAEGSACDPVGQCGCPAGSTCFLDPDTHKGACSVPITGQRTQGEHCGAPTECKPGLVCLTGTSDVCTRYCNVNADCGADNTCFKTTANEIGFCLDRCSRAAPTNDCAEGLVCATLSFPPGDFCWKPVDCTMLRRDGKCQEKTGLCTKGSDPEDCCTIPEGSACNPFQQCGCEAQAGTSCYVLNDRTFQCRTGGMQKVGETCSSTAPCGGGAVCADQICRKLCEPDGQSCGDDAHCMPLDAAGKPEDGTLSYGACYAKCDFAANNCTGQTVCAKVSAQLQICSIPTDPCPGGLIGDGKCDDTSPGGSRLCALGTDSDCDAP
ncbi:MAG TPA: hypothetical protein VFN67_19960 [Polyangiales bacterium]|nr:hypothetical protein [Polyangiales bacterium]